MLQFKNGRLYFDVAPEEISFAIPDGFWLETEPEGISADSVTLRTEDRKTVIELYVERKKESTERSLKDMFNDAPEEELVGPYPVSAGVSGAGEEIHGCGIGCAGTAECAAALNAGEDSGNTNFLVVSASIEDPELSPEERREAVENVFDRGSVKELMDSIEINFNR